MFNQYILPIVPGVRRYPTITPFTYRDGLTYAKTLEILIKAMKELIDETNEVNDDLYDTVVSLLNDKINEINVALNDQETSVDTKISDLTNFVNDSVDSIVNASIEVQDSLVAQMVNDPNSGTSVALNKFKTVSEALTEYNILDGLIFQNSSDIGSNASDISDAFSEINSIEQELNGRLSKIFLDSQYLTEHVNAKVASSIENGKTIVFVGSSTTSHGKYVETLISELEGGFSAIRLLDNSDTATTTNYVRAYNHGLSSANSLTYLDVAVANAVSAKNPSIVFHGVGSSDYRLQRTPESYATNVSSAIARVSSNNQLLHVIMHQHERMDFTPAAYVWQDYLDALKEEFKNVDNVIIVDASKAMRKAGVYSNGGNEYGLMSSDEVHLTDYGSRVLGKIVARILGISSGGGTGWVDLESFLDSNKITSVNKFKAKNSNGVVNINLYDASGTFTADTNTIYASSLPVEFRPEAGVVGALFTGTGKEVGVIMLLPSGNLYLSLGSGSVTTVRGSLTFLR